MFLLQTMQNNTVEAAFAKESLLADNMRVMKVHHGFDCPRECSSCDKFDCNGWAVASVHPRFPSWCVRVQCSHCSRSWNACKICAPIRKQSDRMTSMDALSKHEETHALEKEPKQKVAIVQCESTTEQAQVNDMNDTDGNECFNGNQLHSISCVRVHEISFWTMGV